MNRSCLIHLLVPALMLFTVSVHAQEYSSTQNTQKKIDNIYLRMAMEDVAYMDIVRLAGPPKAHQTRRPDCPFKDTLRDNQLIFYSYVFFPHEVRQNRKYPLLVFPHGGIHGTFGNSYIHILREMVAQGYIVVCPDYRGSVGYSKSFYQAIDYGGLENEDVLAARDYMVENYDVVDPDRVGIIGWSHGGMITLMNILRYPDKYACGYAGVPVSDVAYRLTYQDPSYKNDFAVSYHIGALPEEKPEEYARRSPVTYAKDLQRPLMITTCLNDDDVSHTEVERMIDSLKFYRKDFEYEIYPKMPGAHVFERIDSKEATNIRFKTYAFLARYLDPPHKFRNVKELRKAGFKYH